jgi:hypothetical protein
MRLAGNVTCMGERGEKGVYEVLIGKPDGKSSFGGPRRKLEDKIKIDMKEIG